MKGNCGEGSEGEESCQEGFCSQDTHVWSEQNIRGNAKGTSGEVSGGNEHVIGNWRKGDLVIKWQRTSLNCVPVFCGK